MITRSGPNRRLVLTVYTLLALAVPLLAACR